MQNLSEKVKNNDTVEAMTSGEPVTVFAVHVWEESFSNLICRIPTGVVENDASWPQIWN